MDKKYDYVSNLEPPSFPDGLDVEVFSLSSLQKANELATLSFDREHVTPFIRKNFSSRYNISYKKDLSSIRLTLDTKYDLGILDSLVKKQNLGIDFSVQELIDFISNNPKILKDNIEAVRNMEVK